MIRVLFLASLLTSSGVSAPEPKPPFDSSTLRVRHEKSLTAFNFDWDVSKFAKDFLSVVHEIICAFSNVYLGKYYFNIILERFASIEENVAGSFKGIESSTGYESILAATKYLVVLWFIFFPIALIHFGLGILAILFTGIYDEAFCPDIRR